MNWSFVPQPVVAGSVLAAAAGEWLADDFLESYVCWREASEALRRAYEQWRGGQGPDRALAFAGYRAALEREEHAALMFGRRVARIPGPPT
jgi:hypothetical protein